MRLHEHVLAGGAAALALRSVLGGDGLWFLAGSVLIDADHYLDYVWHNGFRDFDPRRFFRYNDALFERTRRPEFLALSLLHTVEAFLAVFLTARWMRRSSLRALLAGMLFHVGLDFIHLAHHGILTKRAVSIVEYRLRQRQLVDRGLQPGRVYAEALAASGPVVTRLAK